MDTKIVEDQGGGVVVGLCHGCWDPLHPDHVAHLQEAKEQVDILVVGVTADAYIEKPGRPYILHDGRARMIEALECVDLVAVNHAHTAIPLIHRFRPRYYFKGSDYRGQARGGNEALAQEIGAVLSFDGSILYTSGPITYRSTDLVERLRDDGS